MPIHALKMLPHVFITGNPDDSITSGTVYGYSTQIHTLTGYVYVSDDPKTAPSSYPIEVLDGAAYAHPHDWLRYHAVHNSDIYASAMKYIDEDRADVDLPSPMSSVVSDVSSPCKSPDIVDRVTVDESIDEFSDDDCECRDVVVEELQVIDERLRILSHHIGVKVPKRAPHPDQDMSDDESIGHGEAIGAEDDESEGSCHCQHSVFIEIDYILATLDYVKNNFKKT